MTSPRVSENLRRVAARGTHQILLRQGRDLGMWLGCGFPKSGTVWLCQLMASYLDKPYPRSYQLPVMMSSVIHGHWPYDARMPKTGYILRDGRDVMVSLYFYSVRALGNAAKPARAAALRETFDRLYGAGFDPADARTNLPRFLEHELGPDGVMHGTTWEDHARDWVGRPQVQLTRYEDLLADTPAELQRLMVALEAPRTEQRLADLAAARFEFRQAAGRASGQEDRTSFLRKGVAGDWRNHFSREAGELFESRCGTGLREWGYETTTDWYTDL